MYCFLRLGTNMSFRFSQSGIPLVNMMQTVVCIDLLS
uniref:Uncharacterized protein n=1 Tax=Arundo donax TaxID=35708 RepID=A0A0A9FU53_ARUDO